MLLHGGQNKHPFAQHGHGDSFLFVAPALPLQSLQRCRFLTVGVVTIEGEAKEDAVELTVVSVQGESEKVVDGGGGGLGSDNALDADAEIAGGNRSDQSEAGIYLDRGWWERQHKQEIFLPASLPTPSCLKQGGQKTQPQHAGHVQDFHLPFRRWLCVNTSWQEAHRSFMRA